jgi:hypothetical protein
MLTRSISFGLFFEESVIWPEGTVVARREMVVLEDDLDGGDAAETVKFALDGAWYEIDLNNKNAKKLRDSLTRYVESGRKVGRGGVVAGARSRGRVTAASDREQNKAIRAWAKKTGKDISDRGRIPQEIVEEYHAKAGRRAS